jgi:uncharacterized protein YbjT (DUF2867 family)
MKNVIIIGASGSLATVVIEELQKKDVHLTLFLRNKNRLSNRNLANVSIVEGDVMDYSILKEAIKGKDVVYVNLAGNLEAMARNIVKAMQETGVKRIIAISSIGIYNTPMQPVVQPYRRLADVIEASGLDYTILRPDWFTNGSEVKYELTPKGLPERGTAISRKSIASFVGELVDKPETYVNENLNIAKPNS